MPALVGIDESDANQGWRLPGLSGAALVAAHLGGHRCIAAPTKVGDYLDLQAPMRRSALQKSCHALQFVFQRTTKHLVAGQ